MKYTFTCFILLFSLNAFSQALQKIVLHEVSGIVQDTTSNGIPGATVMLVSATDTLKMMANDDGIFLFNNVKSAVFSLTVSSIGFAKVHRKYFFNTEKERLVLEPIILKDEKFVLNEIKIKGKVGIIYKTDTVEYRASDYKVREYANVGELLKKMEGIDVDKMGKVTHNGEAVLSARFNGKKYFDGDIQQAIKELPADIVEKIQIIDDYGEQAELTGIKSGIPVKMLNVVSKTDKAVGNLAELSAEAGNDKRYGFIAGLRQINGTRQLGVKGLLNQTQAGVATPGQTSAIDATDGLIKNRNIDLIYANTLSKSIEVEWGYKFTSGNNNTQQYNTTTEVYNSGLVNANIKNQNNTGVNNHNFLGKITYKISPVNRLIVNASLNLNQQKGLNLNSLNQSGIIKTNVEQKTVNETKANTFNIEALFIHRFNKDRRIFSVDTKFQNGSNDFEMNNNNHLIYYNPQNSILLLDSISNLTMLHVNRKSSLNTKTTFSEPLTAVAKLDFSHLFNRNGYDNSRITENNNALGNIKVIDSLNSFVNYAFTENRMAANYAFDDKKIILNVGMSVITTTIKGTSLNTEISRNNFNLAPIFRFSYRGSKRFIFSLNYNAQSIEPTFMQLQPIADLSNLQNVVFGNPNLKTTFRHGLNGGINKYFTKAGIDFNLNLSVNTLRNKVVQNILIVPDTLNSLKRETRYVNLNGDKSFGVVYTLAKNFTGGIFSIEYFGMVTLNKTPLMNNNLISNSQTLLFTQKVSVQANVLKWFEMNPVYQYTKNTSTFDIAQSNSFNFTNHNIGMVASIYFSSLAILNFDVSKNYINGIIANVSKDPFILNASFSQRMFKRKNGVLALKAYDLFKQNNFVNRKFTNNTVVETKTNTLSRYFLLSFTWAPQKWTGSKNSSGLRNGDGSFVPMN